MTICVIRNQAIAADKLLQAAAIIEGIGASQYGIGIVSARLRERVLLDERSVIPIGWCNPKFGVTLSLPSVVGRDGVQRIIQPEMSDSEQKGLQYSAVH